MSNLRIVANEYHAHANALAARAERQDRNLTPQRVQGNRVLPHERGKGGSADLPGGF